VFEATEKTAARAGVAGRAIGNGLQHQTILIAVHEDFADMQEIAGRLAFQPQALSATRPEMRPAAALRQPDCLRVHMRHHQHFTGFGMGDDRRQQAGGIEFWLERFVHA